MSLRRARHKLRKKKAKHAKKKHLTLGKRMRLRIYGHTQLDRGK